MTTLVLTLFTLAWALVLFAVIRALLLVSRQDRRVAAWCAFAVAGAFAGGALSPFSLWSRPAATPPEAPAAAPAAPASAAKAVNCPAGAKIAGSGALGHIDAVASGPTQLSPGASIVVANGNAVELGGWIVTSGHAPANAFCVILDGRSFAAQEQYGIDRPDVATFLGSPADESTGFDAKFVPPDGSHTVSIGVVEADGATVHLLAPPLPIRVR